MVLAYPRNFTTVGPFSPISLRWSLYLQNNYTLIRVLLVTLSSPASNILLATRIFKAIFGGPYLGHYLDQSILNCFPSSRYIGIWFLSQSINMWCNVIYVSLSILHVFHTAYIANHSNMFYHNFFKVLSRHFIYILYIRHTIIMIVIIIVIIKTCDHLSFINLIIKDTRLS